MAYVPSLESTRALLDTLHHGDSTEPSTSSSTEPSTSSSAEPSTSSSTESRTCGSTCNPAFLMTAQATYPNYDPAVFVLPNLPWSVSESTSVTLSDSSTYSSETRSQLSSLLGISFSRKRTVSTTFKLNTKILRVLSLTQYSEVFSNLIGLYGNEIKQGLMLAGGTLYFVVGIKLATDATVEKHEQGQRSVVGNMVVNATQVTGLGTRDTAGVELGQILGGRSVQKELESATTEVVKGERAFAMEYCCVKLRRKINWAQMTCSRVMCKTIPFKNSLGDFDCSLGLPTVEFFPLPDLRGYGNSQFKVALNHEVYMETFDCLD